MKTTIFFLLAVAAALCGGGGRHHGIPLDPSRPDTVCTAEVVPPGNGGADLAGLRDRAADVLSRRLDGMGLRKFDVSPEGDTRIAVRLPGMKQEDLDRVLSLLRWNARLEFRVVAEQNDEWVERLFYDMRVPGNFAIVYNSGYGSGGLLWKRIGPPDAEELARLREFAAHPGFDLLLEERPRDGEMCFLPWYVSRDVELSAMDVESASAGAGPRGEPEIELAFTDEGRRKFAELTRDLAPGGAKNPTFSRRRYLAIVLNDRVLSAPYVRDEISGGKAVITGLFAPEEARTLAECLNAKPLPCDLRLLSVAPAP